MRAIGQAKRNRAVNAFRRERKSRLLGYGGCVGQTIRVVNRGDERRVNRRAGRGIVDADAVGVVVGDEEVIVAVQCYSRWITDNDECPQAPIPLSHIPREYWRSPGHKAAVTKIFKHLNELVPNDRRFSDYDELEQAVPANIHCSFPSAINVWRIFWCWSFIRESSSVNPSLNLEMSSTTATKQSRGTFRSSASGTKTCRVHRRTARLKRMDSRTVAAATVGAERGLP